MTRFVVFEGSDGQWYWRLVAGNGQVIAAGEAYTRKRDALRAIRAVRRAIWTARVMEGG